MRFKEWLNEMAGIQNMDTSNIDLVPQDSEDGGYEYDFSVKNERYVVEFRAYTKTIYDRNLPAWGIGLIGPRNYQLTNKMEGAATAVYTQLLLAIKKLFEIEVVNLIKFSPANDKMSLVYDRLFDRYLSKDFIRFEKHYYIRKSTLREILSTTDSWESRGVYNRMIRANRTRLADKKGTEAQANLVRKLRLIAPSVVGKFVVFKWHNSEKVAYVKNFINGGSPHFEALHYDEYDDIVQPINFPIVWWQPNAKPDPFQVERLIKSFAPLHGEEPSLAPSGWTHI